MTDAIRRTSGMDRPACLEGAKEVYSGALVIGGSWVSYGAAAAERPTSPQALSARTASSRATAPHLLSDRLALPHLGDWTQEGQPASQSPPAMPCGVAPSQSRAAWKPRSAKPAPPSYPSKTKTLSRPVAGGRAAD